MAKSAKHLKAHQFKKGAPSPNPHGRPVLSPAIKALRNITIDTYREVIEVVLTGNISDLKAMVEDPNTSALQVGVATSFMKAIKSGDYGVIEQIASRIVGKIPDVINVNSNNKNTTALTVIDEAKLKAAMVKINNEY